MATPIAPTPILTGEAARSFEESIENDVKETPERLELMRIRSKVIEDMLTFDF